MEKELDIVIESLFSVIPLFKKKLFKPNQFNETSVLSPSHYHILYYVAEKGCMPISEIGKGINISKPNMSPLVNTLIKLNFIKKVKDQYDKRFTNIDLTHEGKAYLEEHKMIVAKELKDKLSKLELNDLSTLANSLHDLKKILMKID